MLPKSPNPLLANEASVSVDTRVLRSFQKLHTFLLVDLLVQI